MAKTYELLFLPKARKEWNKLAPAIRIQFAKILSGRLENPRVPSAALHDMRDCCKIKLRDAGYRLVYRVEDEEITVTMIVIGRRDEEVYETAVIRQ